MYIFIIHIYHRYMNNIILTNRRREKIMYKKYLRNLIIMNTRELDILIYGHSYISQ